METRKLERTKKFKIEDKDKVNLADSYKYYRLNCFDYPAIDNRTYLKIVSGMFLFLFQLILAGHDIRLGDRLGNLGIRGKKIEPSIDEETGEVKGLSPSWGKTRENWTARATEMGLTFKQFVKQVPQKDRPIIYCFNEHSDGLRYKLYWYKKKSSITHITYYSFCLSDPNKKLIRNAAFNGKDYIERIKRQYE